jgi:hypothetical protein
MLNSTMHEYKIRRLKNSVVFFKNKNVYTERSPIDSVFEIKKPKYYKLLLNLIDRNKNTRQKIGKFVCKFPLLAGKKNDQNTFFKTLSISCQTLAITPACLSSLSEIKSNKALKFDELELVGSGKNRSFTKADKQELILFLNQYQNSWNAFIEQVELPFSNSTILFSDSFLNKKSKNSISTYLFSFFRPPKVDGNDNPLNYAEVYEKRGQEKNNKGILQNNPLWQREERYNNKVNYTDIYTNKNKESFERNPLRKGESQSIKHSLSYGNSKEAYQKGSEELKRKPSIQEAEKEGESISRKLSKSGDSHKSKPQEGNFVSEPSSQKANKDNSNKEAIHKNLKKKPKQQIKKSHTADEADFRVKFQSKKNKGTKHTVASNSLKSKSFDHVTQMTGQLLDIKAENEFGESIDQFLKMLSEDFTHLDLTFLNCSNFQNKEKIELIKKEIEKVTERKKCYKNIENELLKSYDKFVEKIKLKGNGQNIKNYKNLLGKIKIVTTNLKNKNKGAKNLLSQLMAKLSQLEESIRRNEDIKQVVEIEINDVYKKLEEELTTALHLDELPSSFNQGEMKSAESIQAALTTFRMKYKKCQEKNKSLNTLSIDLENKKSFLLKANPAYLNEINEYWASSKLFAQLAVSLNQYKDYLKSCEGFIRFIETKHMELLRIDRKEKYIKIKSKSERFQEEVLSCITLFSIKDKNVIGIEPVNINLVQLNATILRLEQAIHNNQINESSIEKLANLKKEIDKFNSDLIKFKSDECYSESIQQILNENTNALNALDNLAIKKYEFLKILKTKKSELTEKKLALEERIKLQESLRQKETRCKKVKNFIESKTCFSKIRKAMESFKVLLEIPTSYSINKKKSKDESIKVLEETMMKFKNSKTQCFQEYNFLKGLKNDFVVYIGELKKNYHEYTVEIEDYIKSSDLLKEFESKRAYYKEYYSKCNEFLIRLNKMKGALIQQGTTKNKLRRFDSTQKIHEEDIKVVGGVVIETHYGND